MTGTAQEIESCWVQSYKHNQEVTVKRDLLLAASKVLNCASVNNQSGGLLQRKLIYGYTGSYMADSLSYIEVGMHHTFRAKALILEVPKD